MTITIFGAQAPIFEIIMLICFGLAWPISIYKSIKSKSTKGKSIYFSFIVLIGYASGSLNKIFSGTYDIAFPFYLLNFIMVFIDTILWFQNHRREKKQLQST